MLDSDLARFYGVTTSALNQAVKRNPERFPDDFAYRLTKQEFMDLKSQNVISKSGRGVNRSPPTRKRPSTHLVADQASSAIGFPKGNVMIGRPE